MRFRRLNVRQRVVIVIGFGVGLYFLGSWVTALGRRGTSFGWVAYAPLSRSVNTADLPGSGLHPWVRLLIWLLLTVVWAIVGVLLLRSTPAPTDGGQANPTD